jgi:hypothetical protein
MHARFDAQLLKSLGGAIDKLLKFAIADLAPHEIQRRMIGPFRRRVIEYPRHRRRRKFCVPAYAGRVPFNPGEFRHV